MSLYISEKKGYICICVFDCLFFFLLCLKASGFLVPRLGIEPRAPAVEVLSPNHWTARKFPRKDILWNKQTFFLKKHALLFVCSLVPDCNPLDCSPPGCSVHGIFQTRILECVAVSFFRRSSQPRDQTCISCVFCTAGGFFTSVPPGKPLKGITKI